MIPISYCLNEVWGYRPSYENMKKMLNLFCYDKRYATDELAQTLQSSIEPGSGGLRDNVPGPASTLG